MSGNLLSAAAILPVENKLAGDLGAVVMGHADPGSEVYSVPLSATGAEPATHYGYRTWASQAWVDSVIAAVGGELPAVDWDAAGTSEAAVREAFAALALTVKPDGEHDGHFDALAASLGLQRIGGGPRQAMLRRG